MSGIRTGFRIENGIVVKYTSYGRKRKNWKHDYRKRSRNKLKHITNCGICGTTNNLSVHHKIPLYKKVDISRENLIKACRNCHDKMENGEIKMVEHILIDEINSKVLAKALEGYGIVIEIKEDNVLISIPHGQNFYKEFVGNEKFIEQTEIDTKETVSDDPTIENV